MTQTDPYALLANYAGRAPSANSMDIAKYILLNADVQRSGTGTANKSSPSVASRIFDILSRPRYAVANATKALITGDINPIDDFISGLAGTQKTGFGDVLKASGVSDPLTRNLVGFGLDVGLDPVNYIPVAGVLSKIKDLRGRSVPAAPVVTSVQKALSKGAPVNPELYGLPAVTAPQLPKALIKSKDIRITRDALASPSKFTTNQLQLDLPGVPTKLKLPDITPAEQVATKVVKPVGQLGFKLDLHPTTTGNTSRELIDKAVAGNTEALSRVTPIVHGVEYEPRHLKLADEIIAKFDPAKSTAAINKAHPDTLNAKQQVWLYHRAINAAKTIARNSKWSASHANKIYAAIEDQLRSKGYVPRLGTGENVSLLDTIRQMGGPPQAKIALDNFAKDLTPQNPVWDAVQGLRAANAVDESKSVKFILDKTNDAVSAVKADSMSDPAKQQAIQRVLRVAKATAKTAPISAASQDATRNLLNHLVNYDVPAAQIAINGKAGIINHILTTGQGSLAQYNHALTLALEKDLGKLPKWAINNNQAAEFLMGRVATWWGQKDLRPLSLTAIGSSSATAAARGQALAKLFKPYSLDDRALAFNLARGYGVPGISQPVSQLADHISAMIDNLVGQAKGASVVTRSAVDMNLLNKWMQNYKVGFTFTNAKKVKDSLGVVHNFSNGTDWLNSWKINDIPGDPQIFLFKFQQAVEQATRERALFDEIGERFGQKIAGGSFRTKVEGYPYLNGYYFSRDIANQIPRVVKDWTSRMTTADPLLRHYDRLLSMWKSGVTIYRPAHHIRNLIGDAYLGWMDNVRSIRPYTLAARVQRTLKGMYPTLADVDQLVKLGVMGKQYGTPAPGSILFRNRSGVGFTAEQIAAVAQQAGLLEHARTIEDIIDLGETSKFKPFGGKVQAIGRSASELISHNTRLAHFIDKVMKSSGTDLPKIFESAVQRARKWHPTGLDLTDFERKFLRRVMPFYSWIRKSTPLLLEGMVMNPGKTLAVPKAYNSIQQAQGMQTNGIADPFPVDQMFPEWLRSEGLGPLSGPPGWLGAVSNQTPPGYVMFGQGLDPLTQMISQVSQPGKTILGGLTPALQIPLALMTGQNLSTGQPISGPDAQPGAMQEYVGAQLPIWSMIQSITGTTPFGTTTKKGRGDQFTESFLNWLTGAGIKGTGPYVRQARYEQSHPLQVQRNAQKQNFLNQLRGAI